MLVIIANDLPPAVRGRLKLWCIEPRPNVFVSGVKDSLSEHIVNYLHKHCPAKSALIMFYAISKPPGYKIQSIGPTRKPLISISGLPLVIENTKDM